MTRLRIAVGDELELSGQALRLRPMGPTDAPYILATWLRSAARAVPMRHRPHAYPELRLEATRALERLGAVVVCSSDATSTIHGYACGDSEAKRLHYAYVPFDLRGHGLGRAVIEAALRGYPDRIEVLRGWPWPSTRFVRADDDRKAA